MLDELLVTNEMLDELSVKFKLLLKIYKEQGHFDKAINAFEKLILKFPEKKTLFATQINDIKKIK